MTLISRKRVSFFQKFSTDLDDVNVDKIKKSEEFPCAKRVLNILLAAKVMKMLHRFLSCSNEWAGI